jgi:hypothetical protein
MVIVLVLAPVALIAVAAVAALVSVARSSIRITADGVTVSNYRRPEQQIPLGRVVRFEATPPVGFLPGLRPRTGVLVLDDGSRIPVRRLSDPEAGQGIEALNARLGRLRDATG